jgi:hypothetical protein
MAQQSDEAGLLDRLPQFVLVRSAVVVVVAASDLSTLIDELVEELHVGVTDLLDTGPRRVSWIS